jgi:hypothetical protein
MTRFQIFCQHHRVLDLTASLFKSSTIHGTMSDPKARWRRLREPMSRSTTTTSSQAGVNDESAPVPRTVRTDDSDGIMAWKDRLARRGGHAPSSSEDVAETTTTTDPGVSEERMRRNNRMIRHERKP